MALCLLGLAGCASSPVPAVRTVKITHTEYLPVPPALLEPCKQPVSADQIETNGDLLRAWLEDRSALLSCGAQVEQIRTLKAPATR